MSQYKCVECWELLAQYKNSDERNCENPKCERAGDNQAGIALESWELV